MAARPNRVASLALFFLASFCLAAPTTAETIAAFAKGKVRQEGFVPLYTRVGDGSLWIEVVPGTQMLYGTLVVSGLGRDDAVLDRGAPSELGLYEWYRASNRVLLVRKTTRFRSGQDVMADTDIERSFPASVEAAFAIEAEESGRVVLNATAFFATGRAVLPQPESGTWEQDSERSLPLPEVSRAFEGNTSVEAMLTFKTTNADSSIAHLLPDPRSLTIRVRHLFLGLPEAGFKVRESDPRVGYLGEAFKNVAAPEGAGAARELAQRWRLEKKNPEVPVSEPIKPITLYLDSSIPPLYRDAVTRGIGYWNTAFRHAGFRDAIVAKDLPEGASLMDIRYPGIQWTTRESGAKSVGRPIGDPRTGQILHGVVRLGSGHVRQTTLWGFSPRSPGTDCETDTVGLLPEHQFDEINQDKLAHTTAHEVGHLLGLAHNMAASSYDGSVMDYVPLDLRLDGTSLVAGPALPASTGLYDEVAVRWGYTPGASREDLEAIVREGLSRGAVFPQTADWRWVEGDAGSDPVESLARQLVLRRQLLAALGPCVLPAGTHIQDLYERATGIYDLHVPAAQAVAAQIGGATVLHAVKGDGQQPFQWLPVATQRRALAALLRAISPDELEVPSGLEPLLLPGARSAGGQTLYSTTGVGFGLTSYPALLTQILLDPIVGSSERLNRLADGAGGLALPEVLDALVHATWGSAPSSDPRRRAIQRVVQSVVVDSLASALNDPLTEAPADGIVLDRLLRLRAEIATLDPSEPETRGHLALARRKLDQVLTVRGSN